MFRRQQPRPPSNQPLLLQRPYEPLPYRRARKRRHGRQKQGDDRCPHSRHQRSEGERAGKHEAEEREKGRGVSERRCQWTSSRIEADEDEHGDQRGDHHRGVLRSRPLAGLPSDAVGQRDRGGCVLGNLLLDNRNGLEQLEATRATSSLLNPSSADTTTTTSGAARRLVRRAAVIKARGKRRAPRIA